MLRVLKRSVTFTFKSPIAAFASGRKDRCRIFFSIDLLGIPNYSTYLIIVFVVSAIV